MAKVDFAELRLIQLKCLLDPKLDLPIKWEEQRAVKTKFFDAYRYQICLVDVFADRKLIEKIRNHGIASILLELEGLGKGLEAKKIIQSANISREKSS